MSHIEGYLKLAEPVRIAILASRCNHFVVDSLVAGAMDALKRHGLSESAVDLIHVPGAFELPLAADVIAANRKHQGIVALGAIVRGETPHFEYLAGSCVQSLQAVSVKHGVPIGLGVLTVNTVPQAIERSGAKAGNKGAEAALAVIEMIDLLKKL
ncbi:MAG: 6,7-dimethyl-8-ribityllumazine synthase [Gammaproteobacteria bacterium]|nr:6,7-dimethyl-8-ribityllumazine synthase [Gammaproteobacteria bacterium]